MPLPTLIEYADQLAQALGVKDSSSKLYLHPDRNARRVAVVQARSERNLPGARPDEVNDYMAAFLKDRNLIEKISLLSGPLRDVILTEFALRYLPNLLEAFRSPVTNLFHNWWTGVLSLVSALPIFAVFMKSKHPAAVGLQEAVVDKFLIIMPDFSIFTSTDDSVRSSAISGFKEWTELLFSLVLLQDPSSLPNTDDFPDSHPEAILNQQLIEWLVNPIDQVANNPLLTQSQQIAYTDMAVSMAAALMSLTTWLRRLPSSKEAFEESEQRRSWWRCEVGRKQTNEGCSGKENDQLLSCGRCQSVRYCSVDHQRADWKAHKSICHASPW